jgi:hypothetical protein
MSTDLPPIVEAVVLRVQPGDAIVLKVDQDVSQDQAERVRCAWKAAVRGSDAEFVPVVVMSGAVSMTVTRVEQ